MAEPATTPSDLDPRLAEALAPHLVLVRLLGEGGMGAVYVARDPALRRTVAVKVLAKELAADAGARARFERESQAVAGLSHPNVVPVYSVGELADGTPYFVMQHVQGRSMAERVAEDGPLGMAEARRVLGEVAAALGAAHVKGIIHRDIKPANILFDEESGRALVSDFGIAAVVPRADRSDTRLTQTGMIVGTPQYMSPEQLLNEPVSDRTDMYALGLLAYELLAGQAAFTATTPQALIAAHLRDTPKPLAELREDVDPEVAALVARCLEKDPHKRPTADEVARRLAPGGGVLLEWPPPGLEPLHRALAPVTLRLWLGSALALGAVMPLLVAGPQMRDALTSGGSLVLLLLGAAGAAVLADGARRALRLGRALTQAVRAGYAWGTVLEVLADPGDTGPLIAGSHAWSAVSAARRSTLRKRRLARSFALLASAALPLTAVALVVMAGSAGLVGAGASWLAPALLAAGPAAARLLERPARRLAAPQRRPGGKPRPAPDPGRLAGAWYQGFETVRQDQALGRGPAGRAALGWLGAGVLATVMVFVVLVVVQLSVIGTLGPAIWLAIIPTFANTTEKVELARLYRDWALPTDSTIPALAAGHVAFALGGSVASNGVFPELPVEPVPPVPWNEGAPAGLFAGMGHNALMTGPSWTALDSAPRRFTPAELAWLERATHHPAWDRYRVLARAPVADFLGGRLALPLPDDATGLDLPLSRFAATKGYGYANTARAAYYLAIGRRDSAELAAREGLNVGYRYMEDSNTLIDVLIGAVLVGVGRDNLVRVYRATGNREWARIQGRLDSALAARNRRFERATSAAALAPSPDFADPRVIRREFIGLVGDRERVRGLRMEALMILGMAPCTNVQELVFGPSDDILEAFAYAYRELARFPSDSALIDVFLDGPTRARRIGTSLRLGPGARLIIAAADVFGGLLGSRRLPGCARMLLTLGAQQ